ncbi:hypothetical protein LguiA_008041 [Lonicera macranthoides]
MTVVKAFICGERIEAPDNMSSIPPEVTSLLIEGIAHNTTGSVFMPELEAENNDKEEFCGRDIVNDINEDGVSIRQEVEIIERPQGDFSDEDLTDLNGARKKLSYNEQGEDVEVSGSPTEKAILQWGLKLGMNFGAVRSDSSVVHAYVFSSEKKQGGVAVKLPNSEVHIHWKGAAEIVLASCTRYIDANGCLVPLDDYKLSLFKKVIDDMAVRSLRCIAFAFRSYELGNIPSDEEKLANWDLAEADLVLLAIVSLKDPCRPGVRDAVQLCMNAGVKVHMITGDNIQTARAIALECGILRADADATEPNTIIEGRVFRALSDTQRQEISEKILVMGRSSPNDKLLFVQALRKGGHVVAVTGDGTSDAPALHEADIGLAMGIQGTQVAKESSDIIILDDHFASVVKAVHWGRSVYANIEKFVQFQLTLIVVAVLINVLEAVSSGDVSYNAVQVSSSPLCECVSGTHLLWVNLIVDTLGLLAMATERPTDNLMDRPPILQREPFITNIVWRNSLTQVLYQVTVLLVLNSQLRSMLNLVNDGSDSAAEVKNTLIFNAFIFCQIFNEFNARKPDRINIFKGITRNHFFIGSVSLIIVLQMESLADKRAEGVSSKEWAGTNEFCAEVPEFEISRGLNVSIFANWKAQDPNMYFAANKNALDFNTFDACELVNWIESA